MQNLALVAAIVLALLGSKPRWMQSEGAQGKPVHCKQVMEKLHSGEKVGGIASELKISRASVYRCRREAREKMLRKRGQETAVPGPVATPK